MSISDIFDEQLIKINVDVKSSDEAIRYASDLFTRKNIVKQGYFEEVIKREREFPTGLKSTDIAVAIPHTFAEYANKNAIAVIRPVVPVPFVLMGTEDTLEDVQLILPLVIKDPDSHMAFLKKLMKLLSDQKILECIIKEESTTKIYHILRAAFSD